MAEVRAMIDSRGVDVDVEVDGGISPATVAGAVTARANVLVAGAPCSRIPTVWGTPSRSCGHGPRRRAAAERQSTPRGVAAVSGPMGAYRPALRVDFAP